MEPLYERTAMLIGEKNAEILKRSSVACIGLGGVGGYALEIVARAGAGRFLLMDGDKIEPSNKNRQIIADDGTVGMFKADAFAERLKKINSEITVVAENVDFNEQTLSILTDFRPDFVIDAIDSVKDKVFLIVSALKMGYNIVSAMGAGNRSGLPKFEITDIYKTEYDPLAKKMRALLKREGVEKLDVCADCSPPERSAAGVIGSVSYVPAMAGVTMGAYALQRLIDDGNGYGNSDR